MNLTEAIFARRAVRSYTSQEVDEATLRTWKSSNPGGISRAWVARGTARRMRVDGP
jgi:hypothetical protein